MGFRWYMFGVFVGILFAFGINFVFAQEAIQEMSLVSLQADQETYKQLEGKFLQVPESESTNFFVNEFVDPPCAGYEVIEKHDNGEIEKTVYGCVFQEISHEIIQPQKQVYIASSSSALE